MKMRLSLRGRNEKERLGASVRAHCFVIARSIDAAQKDEPHLFNLFYSVAMTPHNLPAN